MQKMFCARQDLSREFPNSKNTEEKLFKGFSEKNSFSILIWAINFIIKSITRSFIMLNTMMKNKSTTFAYISIPFLTSFSQHAENMPWTWSQERDQNIGKTCVFIFHHNIQHDEACGYTFYNTFSLCLTIVSNKEPRRSTFYILILWCQS